MGPEHTAPARQRLQILQDEGGVTQYGRGSQQGLGSRLAPQEFLVKWALQDELRVLAASGTQAVLVRKQAQTLLDAFRVNAVF